jgi:acyl dehydratase
MITEEIWFEQYELGARRDGMTRTITETDIVIHAGHTGDFFPHHMDAEWCATQAFGQRIAHGTLVLSVAVGLTASAINPRSMSYGYDRIRFIRPVFIGDTLHVCAEISGKRDHKSRSDVGLLDETVTVTNQRGETVLSLVHIYLVERLPANP